MSNYFNFVLFSVFEKAICIYVKIGVSIRTACYFFSIYVDFSVMVNALEFNKDFLILIFFRHGKFLGILVISADVPSNVSLTGTLLGTRLAEHGVMGQSHRISRLIAGKTFTHPSFIKINLLHTVNCSFLFRQTSLSFSSFLAKRTYLLTQTPLNLKADLLHS